MKGDIGGVDTIQVVAGATLTAGVPVLIGTSIFGVPETDAVSGQVVVLKVAGKVRLPKTAALQIDVGDAIYFDAGNSVVNKTSTAQREVGWAISNAANPSAYVDAYLVPTVRTSVAA